MSIDFHWRLSTADPADARRGEWQAGERPWARSIDARSRDRQINRYDYLAQVARAADLTGFDGLVIPDEDDGEEPWIVTGALLRDAPALTLVTSVRPGASTAVYAAKMAASVQRFSHGRQAWRIDLDPADPDREARAREFIAIARGVWGEEAFTHEGRFFMVGDGALGGLIRDVPPPALHFHGIDPAALALSAEYGAAHVFDAAPLDVLREQAAELRSRAGRDDLRIGIAFALLARETQEDVDAERARRTLSPHALVGTYDAVAERIVALSQAGFTLFELTADRQIEEAHIAGEQVIARVRRRLTPFLPAAA